MRGWGEGEDGEMLAGCAWIVRNKEQKMICRVSSFVLLRQNINKLDLYQKWDYECDSIKKEWQ